MHEAYLGSPEAHVQNSAELLDVTPIAHEQFPLDSANQRTLRGAIPLMPVGQEAQVATSEPQRAIQVAKRSGVAGATITSIRHHAIEGLRRAA